ncbi:hypothetical protein MKZ08_07825 [Viridibacillus sp. FSL R5-0477]|uniref:Lipoprotein n=1 Tax=Viridibacillus arenosi FSL R5-213 TaxID=1227360 RepID=W4EYT3_9BACL|nr:MULTISPECIES: hypothetical protein [Viridibacillus]ETT85227.1 hypothetical protein C176_11039 [Viridibacillus arenosi FSL R5-213]OMC81045.1 hypothetical protein BK130_17170 [Viridibacillus sp. FSL H8-0123]OMC89297.1 hypothetical protein BK137_17755 [Viridibacillus arenosi]
MRNYKIACISTCIILLSGCNAFSSQTEEPSLKVASEEITKVVKKEPVILDVTDMEKEEPIRGFYPLAIDEEIASPIGESKSYFTHSGDSPFKITLLNTGTESFLYKIQNLDKETTVANGVLKSNESYEKVFDGFPEGAYVISYLVEEEGLPVDIKLKVKVEELR